LGATGINYTDGVNLIIANTPREFAEKLASLRDDRSLIDQIGNEARLLAEREYNLQTLSSKLTYFYGKL
jgi:glycosyltransferase involved in cell wall biosynthesis